MVENKPLSFQTPLAIEQLGIISSLAVGWELTAAAIQCGYDGFMHNGKVLSAPAEWYPDKRGIERFAYFLRAAVSHIELDNITCSIILCLQEPTRVGEIDLAVKIKQLSKAISKQSDLMEKLPSEHWDIISSGRMSIVVALKQARKIIDNKQSEKVLILSVDSLLLPQTLNAYSESSYQEGNKPRLLTNDNSDGFIPGEAAGAILVGSPTKGKKQLLCTATAITTETATLDSTEVLKGIGLSSAIKTACQRAEISLADCYCRIASASGEEYFFREAGLAQTKVLTEKVETQPLRLPASHVGEVGAVIGSIMLAMAKYDFDKDYNKNNHILCHISNDDELRGAFVLTQSGGD